MISTRSAIIAVATLATLTLAACGGNSGSGAETKDSGPMTIEVFHALSGPLAPSGEAMSIGIRAAVNVINDEGGVRGEPLKVNITDDAGSPDQLAAKLQELLSSRKPHAVLPGTANEIPAAIPILNNAEVFTVHHFTGYSDPKEFPNIFGSVFTIPTYAKSLVNRAEELGLKSVGVVASDDVAGDDFWAVIGPELEKAGIDATFVKVPPAAVDAVPQMQQALADDPDGLIFTGFYAAAPAVIKARALLAPGIPTLASNPFSGNNFTQVGNASDYDGIEFQQQAAAVKGGTETVTEAFKKFYAAALEEAGGTLKYPINVYYLPYNEIMVAAYAANLSDSYDAAKMTKALEDASPEDLPNHIMPATYSADDHSPEMQFEFVSYGPIENGLIVPTK